MQESKFYFNGEFAGTFETNYEKERQLFFVNNLDNYSLEDGSNELKIVAITKLVNEIKDYTNTSLNKLALNVIGVSILHSSQLTGILTRFVLVEE